MADGSTEASPSQSRVLQAAWLLIPISILIVDLEIRWVREFRNTILLFPGWYFSSVVVSVAGWGAIATLLRGGRARFVAAPVVAFGLCALAAVNWGCKLTRYFELTPSEVVYLYEEPLNALNLLVAGLSLGAGPLLLGLGAVWTLALLAASRQPSGRRARRVAVGVLVGALVYVVALPPFFEMRWAPYQSDVRAVYLLVDGTWAYATGKRSYNIGFERRQSVPKVEPKAGPSILIVVGESMRRDHISALSDYPRPTTPRLQQFVSDHPDETFVFDRHVPTAAGTFWALNGLLSGRYPIETREAIRTAPALWQYADAAGYATFVVTAQSWAWATLREFWLDPGPDHFGDAETLGFEITNDTGGDDVEVVRVVERWLANETVKPPFFGVVQMNATHWPFIEKPGVPWELETETDRYDAATARTDQALGMLLDTLEARGLLAETIVVFTSDHAESLAENITAENMALIEREDPALFHGARAPSCEPVFINAPLLVYVPHKWQTKLDMAAVRANRDAVTSHTDLTATFVKLFGVAPVAPLHGFDLFEPIPRDRVALCLTAPTWNLEERSGFGARQGDDYLYLRADLSRPYLYDLSQPAGVSVRTLPPVSDPSDLQRVIQAVRMQRSELGGVADFVGDRGHSTTKP